MCVRLSLASLLLLMFEVYFVINRRVVLSIVHFLNKPISPTVLRPLQLRTVGAPWPTLSGV